MVHIVAYKLFDLSEILASVGGREAPFPLPHGRGDELPHEQKSGDGDHRHERGGHAEAPRPPGGRRRHRGALDGGDRHRIAPARRTSSLTMSAMRS